MFSRRGFGKDPTVETSFLLDMCGISMPSFTNTKKIKFLLSVKLISCRHGGVKHILSLRRRQRSKRSVKGCENSGYVSKSM